MRRAAKVDANQQSIVEALRAVGVHVDVIGWPVDLLCSHRNVWHVLEVKNSDGKDQLTKDQIEFIARSQGEVHVVRSPDEAIAAVLGKDILR